MSWKRILCILQLITLLAALLGCAASPEAQSYRRGNSALDQGRLAEAAGLFGPLGDYQDSPQKLQEIFDGALSLYTGENYSQAAEIFRALAEFEFPDARDYAAASGALACLENLDGSGARAALADGDPASRSMQQAIARAELMLFPGTAVLRPEFAAPELASGELSAEIRQTAEGANPEYLYAMDRQVADRVYRQYRDYCKNTFPDSFRDESENYFSFRADGVLCYVSNFHSGSGGMVILISAV